MLPPRIPPGRVVRSTRTAESGASLVEMMVVLLIIAVITGFAVMSMRSSRATGGRLELRAAASMYADAVSRYQTDHGRKVPILGSPDWPNSSAAKGPVKRLQIGTTVVRPYLRKAAPELMTRRGPNGATFGSRPAIGSPGGRLVYVTTGAYSFRIDAYWEGRPICSAGDVPAGGNPC